MSVSDDNVQIGLGNESGAQIATDFDGTSHYQLIKLVHGTPDTGFTFVGDGSAGGSVAPLPVRLFADDVGGSPFQGTKIGGATAMNVNILGAYGNTGVATLYAGTSDSVKGYPLVTVGNTGDVWVIRSLTGGTVGYAGATGIGRDFVVIQGICGGYEVAITGGASPLPVQGTDFDIRSLTGGTVGYAGATVQNLDFVVVQGVSGGYPVRSAIWNQLGTTAAGISGAGDTGSLLVAVSNEVGITVDTVGITWPGGGVNVTGTDLDIRSLTGGTLGSTHASSNLRDFVAVQGVSGAWPVVTRLVGGTGNTYAPVGMSGSALNVNIIDAGITVSVDVTDTSFMIEGFTGSRGVTAPPISIRGYTGDGASGAPVIVAGAVGATAIGVTAGAAFNVQGTATVSASNLDIRNLTGGTVGGTGSNYPWDRDFVVVQGISGGFPVRSTIWNVDGTTAAGLTGTGVDGGIQSYIMNEVGVTFGTDLTFLQTANSVGVTLGAVTLGVTFGTTVNVTGTDLDIRSLTGGTGNVVDYVNGFSGGGGFAIDTVAVHGMSLGYPVGTRLYGGSGATIVPLSVVGNALDVNIVGTDATINVDITDTSLIFEGFTGSRGVTAPPISIRGYTGDDAGSAPVIIAGAEGATAMAITGGTVALPVQGSVTVSASDLDIRGLTYTGVAGDDFVGITGPIMSTITDMKDDVAGISTGIAEIQSWMTTNTAGITLPNAIQMASLVGKDFATESSGNLETLADGISGDAGTSQMRVYVMDNVQPPTLNYGQQTVPTGTSTKIIDGSTLILKSGINIKSLQTNTALVFVGSANVATTSGYPLSAGEELFLEVNDAAKVFTISSSSGQTACWTAS